MVTVRVEISAQMLKMSMSLGLQVASYTRDLLQRDVKVAISVCSHALRKPMIVPRPQWIWTSARAARLTSQMSIRVAKCI